MKEILFYREGKADYPSFFSDKLICKWIEVIAGHYNKSVGAINFIFCDDDYILAVNRQYLKHDYYTDVITFDYCEGDILSGDVFISLDTVKSNSEMFSTFFVPVISFTFAFRIISTFSFFSSLASVDRLPRNSFLL